VTAYRIISAEKASGVPVPLACELLEVSRSGYDEWSTRAPSDRELTDAWLTEKIKQIHAENREVYGSPRIRAELRMTHGVEVGRKRVERLMAQAGISGLVARKRGRTTVRVQGVRVADDLVKRQFRPDAPDVLWLADFSYLRTWEGWLYLAAAQDAFSRRVVGWCMADHMREELVIDALMMAVRRRRPDPGVIHHSDQGGQHVSLVFGQACTRAGISSSMGSVGDCYDTQRGRGDVLRDAEEGARLPSLVADPTGAVLGGVRVHRGLLQPPAAALDARDALPGRVRGAARLARARAHAHAENVGSRSGRGRGGSPAPTRARKTSPTSTAC
jgi:putative transposase